MTRAAAARRWRSAARALRVTCALGLVVATAACNRGGERSRTSGSAIWTDDAAAPLSVTDLSHLEQAGVDELFVDAARLQWQGAQPQLAPQPLPHLPRRTRAMLVVRGEWPLEATDPAAAARALVGALDAVARRGEESGLAVAGWHLDLRGAPRQGDVKLLAELRTALEPTLLLAITAPRDALSSDALADAAKSTDFLVAFLYGVREGEPDDAAAWDFQQVQAAAKKLDALGEPYLLGVVVRGAATVVRNGADVAEIPSVTLADLAWNRALRVRHGFSLEGVDRQVYAFTADYPTRIGGTAILPGDDVRVVGTSSAHVQELHKQIGAWKLAHCIGELYYRLPHHDEGLSLGLTSLTRATTGERSLPAPQVQVTRLGGGVGHEVVQVTLDNPTEEASDLGGVDSNYVELQAVGGVFGEVKQGSFYRYDLLAPGPGGRLIRSPNPVLVRLFVPVLAPGAHLQSGPIVVRTVRTGLADVLVHATFLAPYGGTAEVGPLSWTKLPKPLPQASAASSGAPPASRRR